MAKKKDNKREEIRELAPITEQGITSTLIENYMPYSMSVIISRAIPEIDGFKPAHRKLLYTMYKMGLLNGARVKSSNVVGATMKLNPHGDAAIYETMVRLTRGNGALLHPFVDSKGSFGKQYSKMAYAASRYTEVKLESICSELFGGIDKDAVDMVDNFDGSMKEPSLLPTTFPNVLVSPNLGIAVGMASNICSFNLAEICDATSAIIEDPEADIMDILKAPDFSTGGQLIYDRAQMEEIYRTGRGSFKVRSKYTFDKSSNCIEITEIPYTTTADAIIDKISTLIKEKKLRDINDVRDETDLNGLKIAIDVKRGTDVEKLMAKLFRLTPLEDSFPCNFNVLIAGTPCLLGVRELLNEWHAFRAECLKREIYYDLSVKSAKLHLLKGLEKILLDIDKAIAIIKSTENDRDVVPNLMKGFDIDEAQAEYVAEIKLRSLNREHILGRIADIEKLTGDIANLEGILSSSKKLDRLIIKQLADIKQKYGKPRVTEILYEVEAEPEDLFVEEEYKVYAVMTKGGYFKRISLQSIRGSDAQKLKDGDEVTFKGELSSRTELLFFTDKAQVYKARVGEFDNIKASELGDYIPTKLGFDEGEKVIFFAPETDFADNLLIVFENGKAVQFNMGAYKTKQNRRKLTNAFASIPVAQMFLMPPGEQGELFLKTHLGRGLIIKSSLVPVKATRSSVGIQIFSLKKGDFIAECKRLEEARIANPSRYRKLKVPSTGAPYNEIDTEDAQTTLI